MGRLPHAWIAPPETRELRELVRHRAKLVAMRSQCKAHVHAVLAKGGVWVPMTDLFGVEGNLLLDKVAMPAPYKERIASLRRFIEGFDAEIDLFTALAQRRLSNHAGYTAIQQIPGIGPVLGAVFVAEIGDEHRFPGPAQLTCWAGLTPSHHESDTTVRRGRITKQGSRLVRWAAIESVKVLPDTSRIGAIREQAIETLSPCTRRLQEGPAKTPDFGTRNNAKVRETTCGYARGVDGVNTPQARRGTWRCHPTQCCFPSPASGRRAERIVFGTSRHQFALLAKSASRRPRTAANRRGRP